MTDVGVVGKVSVCFNLVRMLLRLNKTENEEGREFVAPGLQTDPKSDRFLSVILSEEKLQATQTNSTQ